jgi:hypothetical protein
LAKLPRSMWRKVKERIVLCVEKVQKDEFVLPYRITYPDTQCGFVFIPVHSDLVRRPDWPTIRLRGFRQLAEAHKYDQRLPKCIGVLVANDGSQFCVDWCLVAYEWIEDIEIQRALDENFPFRAVKAANVHGYLLHDEAQR